MAASPSWPPPARASTSYEPVHDDMIRARILAAVALLLVMIAALIGSAAATTGSPVAAPSPSCPGAVRVGSVPGVQLKAFGLHAVDVSCATALGVVREYLTKKLNLNGEVCAGRATNPPFPGCEVDAYLCRATARPNHHGVAPELCSDEQGRISFREYDYNGV